MEKNTNITDAYFYNVTQNISKNIIYKSNSISYSQDITTLKYLDGSAVFEDLKENFQYPCTDSTQCSPYAFSLPRGNYLIELYGASGGTLHSVANAMRLTNDKTISESDIKKREGNALPKPLESSGGAGGYVRGILHLKELTKVFLHIGGKGKFEASGTRTEGGYNGGGRGMVCTNGYLGGGGGGATDLRIGVDDAWHRVMVAAGGGGSDGGTGTLGGSDDGAGGCGGGLEGQGMWSNGVYITDHIATQSKGFSFFQGEGAQENRGQNPDDFFESSDKGLWDKAGAGGGWFGGFSRHGANAGAGGGSSFVLHRNAEIPTGIIIVHDDMFQNPKESAYAFDTNSEYCLTDYELFSGIWSGNGMARITFIGSNECETKANKAKLITTLFAMLLF